ncbi:MAG TPA: GTP cyclohydrolase I FolE [Myxococcota bacterium]|nr:GTP cyclohydrolase I FolE [Myxococcota bacterium]
MSRLEEIVSELLEEIGEDPRREGLLRTPKRVARSFEFLTQGYRLDPQKILNDAVFEESYNEMLIVKDIDFYSLCEHHMLPFFGRAHVAYLPNGRIVGLSKIARLVEMYSRRLQVQERLTNEIAHVIDKVLQPRGVAVILEAQHLCMMMRGVQKQNSYAISSAMLGSFESDPKTRAEFVQLVHQARAR